MSVQLWKKRGWSHSLGTLLVAMVLVHCGAPPRPLTVRFETGIDQPMGDDEGRAVRRVFYHMDGDPNLRLVLIGHADNVGTSASNEALSFRRARHVRAVILEHGIAPSRVTIAAFGAGRARSSNDTEEGRAENRRVELFFYYPNRGSLTQQYGAPLRVLRE